MELTYGYERKTFWKTKLYTEDINTCAGVDDLKKAFTALKKDQYAAVKFCRDRYGFSFTWDSPTDFNNDLIVINVCVGMSSDRIKCSFATARKRAIQLFIGDLSAYELLHNIV